MKLIYQSILIFLLALSLPCVNTQAQNIAIGAFRTHLSYLHTTSVAAGNTHIYAASPNGLFSYSKEYQEVTKITPLDGLIGNGISFLHFDKATDQLIIGYQDGIVDFFHEPTGEIKTVRDISSLNTLIDKTILHIYSNAERVYVSTSLGIVVIHANTKKILETYENIGSSGNRTKVVSSGIADGKIWAATDEGVRYAPMNTSTNLQDFSSWSTFSSFGGTSITALATRENQVFLSVFNDFSYQITNGTSSRLLSLPNLAVRHIHASESGVFFSTSQGLFKMDTEGRLQTLDSNIFTHPSTSVTDGSTLCVAQNQTGLILYTENTAPKIIYPTGPYASTSFHIHQTPEQGIFVVSGGIDETLQPWNSTNGLYYFKDEKWNNYVANGDPEVVIQSPLITDPVFATSKGTETYIASRQSGLFILDRSQNQFTSITSDNSPLPTSEIAGVVVGEGQELMVACYGVSEEDNPYYFRSSSGNWRSFGFPNLLASRFPKNIMKDSYKNYWVSLYANLGGGILVFNENGQYRLLNTSAGAGALPSESVNVIILDKEDAVWVGTDRGLRVFYDSYSILEAEEVEGSRLYYNAREMMKDEKITAIAVDGGNRKWIGTENGLWLFSEDGSELFHTFTTDNSPLPDNYIQSLAIQEETGEVFIGTSLGLISYRSDATAPKSDFNSLSVFPNPFLPAESSVVTIQGLMNNSTVKITDENGGLCFEGKSQGGTLTWNGLNYKSEPMRSGVYIIWVADSSETWSAASRFILIR